MIDIAAHLAHLLAAAPEDQPALLQRVAALGWLEGWHAGYDHTETSPEVPNPYGEGNYTQPATTAPEEPAATPYIAPESCYSCGLSKEDHRSMAHGFWSNADASKQFAKEAQGNPA